MFNLGSKCGTFESIKYDYQLMCQIFELSDEFTIKRNTVEHDFNGHVINGIHGVNGKKCYYGAFHLPVNFIDWTDAS